MCIGIALLRPAAPAEGCAFLRTPYTYEAEQVRTRYLDAFDAASSNQLFPGDAYFGLPPVETGTRANRAAGTARIPAVLLKAVSWVESGMNMASRSVPFSATGPALVSFDCGHGLTQVTSGMTVPLGTGNAPSANQVLAATHYAYNIARGAAVLANKWNDAPEIRPIVGTDTGSDPNFVENWYYAIWAYNGFTGPGSNISNHPADPGFGGWPRAAYRCDGTQSRTRYPYQEMVWGCMASPPTAGGRVLWAATPATLPDLTNGSVAAALALANFTFPYAAMDLPTPAPAHLAVTPVVAPDFRTRALGLPALSVSATRVTMRLNGTPQEARATVQISNAGTGILSWAAIPSDSWLVVDPPAGVALGGDMPCTNACSATGTFTITVNPVLLPRATASATVRVISPNGGAADVPIRVDVTANFESGAPGASRAY